MKLITVDYTTYTNDELIEAYDNVRDWRQQASYRTATEFTRASGRMLQILDELHRRALKPRRHLAPERGRGRVWDSQNAGGE